MRIVTKCTLCKDLQFFRFLIMSLSALCMRIYLHLCVIMNCSVFINKVVEGSGSEGAPKYVGGGVTYRVFLGY